MASKLPPTKNQTLVIAPLFLPKSMPPQQDTSHPAPLQLERALGPLTAGALLAGTVIGTGIFLVPSTMARETGSVAGVFLVWLFGAILSLCGAFTYAELGSSLPAAGGEYVFLRKAYGPLWGFLFGWQQIVIGKTGSIAAIGLAASLFLSHLYPPLTEDILTVEGFKVSGMQVLAIGWIALMTFINVFGVGRGGALQALLTALKLGAILGLIGIAFTSGEGSWDHFTATSTATTESPTRGTFIGYGAALAAALWAYDGWNNLTMVSGEIRQPHKTIPRVLIIGILGVAAIYILTNLAYFLILPLEEVQKTQGVAQEVAIRLLGENGGKALTLAAILSTLAALNGAILAGARIFYAMADDGLLYRGLNRLHPRFKTPIRALLLLALLATLLILILGHDKVAFERVLDYALLGTWGFYGLTSIAVIVLRVRHPELPRPYLTVGYPYIPLIFSLVAFLFCCSIALRRPEESLLGLALLLLGVPFYLYFKGSAPQGKP